MTLLADILRGGVRLYQLFLAPVIPATCRHVPSCSHYAMDALAVHGPFRGGWLTLKRLGRCHPWGTSGYDPVPGTDPEHDACRCARTAAHGRAEPA